MKVKGRKMIDWCRLLAWQTILLLLMLNLCTIAFGHWLEHFGHTGAIKKLQGQVRDGLDAAIPRATIEITDLDKGQTFSITADEKGRFKKNRLPSGKYQIKVSARGFNLSEYTVNIDVNDHQALNKYTVVRLSPGCASGNSGVTLVNKINDPSFSKE